MSEIAKRIKEFGLSKYSTLKEFSEALGISYPHLYQYIKEDNPSLPGTPLLVALRKLGCDLNWLLGDGGEHPQQKLLKEIEELRRENEVLRKKSKSMVTAVREAMTSYNKKP